MRVQFQEMCASACVKEEPGGGGSPAQGERCTASSLKGQATCMNRRPLHSHLTPPCPHIHTHTALKSVVLVLYQYRLAWIVLRPDAYPVDGDCAVCSLSVYSVVHSVPIYSVVHSVLSTPCSGQSSATGLLARGSRGSPIYAVSAGPADDGRRATTKGDIRRGETECRNQDTSSVRGFRRNLGEYTRPGRGEERGSTPPTPCSNVPMKRT